jgi:cephalosporin hydroxylase
MELILNSDSRTLTIRQDGSERQMNLYGKEAFEQLSRWWVKTGWNQKYAYQFAWMGRPIIQNPEDMIRIQELIYRLRPDVIVESGIAHGGSLIYYASLCKAMGHGRVLGVDIEIRPHNRRAIEAHEMFDRIEMIEGDAVAPETVEQVRRNIEGAETVLVILDSCHSYDHVSKELDAYSPFVTPGSYIVATDGIMYDLHDVPLGHADWDRDNPTMAARDFLARNDAFELAIPERPFCETELDQPITHWPEAWLRRKA